MSSFKSHIALAVLFLLALPVSAQEPVDSKQPELRILSEFKLCPNDKDASMSYKEYDSNDKLCALVKVNLSNPLSNRLTMSLTNATPISKEIEGQMWFWIPQWVKNISFACLGYKPTEPKGVSLEAGKVYAVTVGSNTSMIEVPVVHQTSGYLHFQFNVPDVKVMWGKSKDNLDFRRNAENGRLAIPLEYGRYTFLFEDTDGLHKSETREIDYNGSTEKTIVDLLPSYNYLSITCIPSGAKIFVDDTPYDSAKKYRKGRHEIYAQIEDYSMRAVEVFLEGDGTTISKKIEMEARFAVVQISCNDHSAKLYLDGEPLNGSSWSGRVASGITHTVESRKESHVSQSTSFTLGNNETRTINVLPPIPIYVSLEIQSDPSFCQAYLDGTYLGETPLKKTVLTGTYKLRLTHPDCHPETISVTLKENEPNTVSVHLEKHNYNKTMDSENNSSGPGTYSIPAAPVYHVPDPAPTPNPSPVPSPVQYPVSSPVQYPLSSTPEPQDRSKESDWSARQEQASKNLEIVDDNIMTRPDTKEKGQAIEITEEEAIPFSLVEKAPSFRGGDANTFSKWVATQLIYPDVAKENGIQGRVIVQFTVEKDGRVTNVKVLRSIEPTLDKEAVRVINLSPKWTPGKHRDRIVKVTYIFPVIFSLDR